MKSSYLTCSVSTILLGLVSSRPIVETREYDLQTVHQFPNLTWIENMAVRTNGQILGTDVSSSRIYLVDPENPQAEPAIVAQFPNQTCVTGIAEVQEDVFYAQSVIGEIYSFTFQPNSTVIWEVDMRSYTTSGQAFVCELAKIPAAGVLNGMTLLSEAEGTILMADSTIGVVWRLNVNTGNYEVVLDDPLLKPIPNLHPAFGVNGIHVVGSVLYFTNSNHALVGKFTISCDGHPTGPGVNISTNVPAADDFAIDSSSTIWLCENVQNTLVRVSPDGQVQTIAGGKKSSALIGPVAAKFGRTPKDRDILYISTDGLLVSPKGQPLTTAGKIAAIDTKTW